MSEIEEVARGLRGVATNPTAIGIIDGYLGGESRQDRDDGRGKAIAERVPELDWCLMQGLRALAGKATVRFERLPACLAYAQKNEHGENVVFSLEYIDLIKNWLVVSRFTDLLSALTTATFANTKDINLAEAFAFANNLLVYWAMRGKISFPDYEYLLTDHVKQEVEVGVVSAIQFVLLHELGHFRLGHMELRSRPIRPSSDLLFVPENLEAYHREELEADRYAISQFKKEHVGYALPAACIAFWPVYSIEHFYRVGAASHPLMINRLAQIQDLAGAGAEGLDIAGIGETILRRRSYITDHKDFIVSVGGDTGRFFEKEFDLRFAERVLKGLAYPLSRLGFDISPSIEALSR